MSTAWQISRTDCQMYCCPGFFLRANSASTLSVNSGVRHWFICYPSKLQKSLPTDDLVIKIISVDGGVIQKLFLFSFLCKKKRKKELTLVSADIDLFWEFCDSTENSAGLPIQYLNTFPGICLLSFSCRMLKFCSLLVLCPPLSYKSSLQMLVAPNNITQLTEKVSWISSLDQ